MAAFHPSMIFVIVVIAFVYCWIFDAAPERDYPNTSLVAEIADGCLRLIVSCSTGGWLAIFCLVAFESIEKWIVPILK